MEPSISNLSKVKAVVESLLFVTKKPLSLSELAKISAFTDQEIEIALNELTAEYDNGRGIRVIKVAHGYIFGTDSANAEYVDRLATSRIETTLSPQALETLAIIAYKQPATKPQIEALRGVYSDGVIDTLVNKKLIEEKGRGPGLGRPILYGTTIEFLRHFGLKEVKDLPPLPENGNFQTVLNEQQ